MRGVRVNKGTASKRVVTSKPSADETTENTRRLSVIEEQDELEEVGIELKEASGVREVKWKKPTRLTIHQLSSLYRRYR